MLLRELPVGVEHGQPAVAWIVHPHASIAPLHETIGIAHLAGATSLPANRRQRLAIGVEAPNELILEVEHPQAAIATDEVIAKVIERLSALGAIDAPDLRCAPHRERALCRQCTGRENSRCYQSRGRSEHSIHSVHSMDEDQLAGPQTSRR